MSKGTILIVEDEKDLSKLLTYNFRREGYKTFAAATAEKGLAAARQHKPDMAVLDIMLPKMDGLELSKELRKETDMPILFLTAKKSETDRVLGLKIGADDYVTKPFSVKELLARVEAVLRRSNGKMKPNKGHVRLGKLTMDVERRDVTVNGKRVILTPKEFDLLRLLMDEDGKVLSRDALLEKVWGHAKGVDIDTRTVDQHVARLRRKIGPERIRIETVAGCGYRLRR